MWSNLITRHIEMNFSIIYFRIPFNFFIDEIWVILWQLTCFLIPFNFFNNFILIWLNRIWIICWQNIEYILKEFLVVNKHLFSVLTLVIHFWETDMKVIDFFPEHFIFKNIMIIQLQKFLKANQKSLWLGLIYYAC